MRSAAPFAEPEHSPGSIEVEGERRVLALLPEEPAGRISTINAGAASFSAALTYRPDEEVAAGSALADLHQSGVRFCSFLQTDDTASATRRISCEVRAFYTEQLTDALDSMLRSVTTYAALTEAVLETSVVRLADPVVPPAALVERLARQLWDARFPVSFGPSWVPAPRTQSSVGIRGAEAALRNFLQTHLGW